MRIGWTSVVAAVFCSVIGIGIANAAEPTQIKVGILLPLTGPFAAVAETQKQGALLAVDVINKQGGLNMPWGRVKVEGVVDDDEAKLDVGVRRYRYMVSEGVKGVGGQTWAPLAYALNAIVSKDPMPYFPICVMAKEAFQKGKLADSSFAAAYSPWTVGYMAGKAAVQTLGKKRIFFLARTDSWGWDMRDGAYAAAKEFGAEIVGYDETALGTNDFTTILQKVRAARPDLLFFLPTVISDAKLVLEKMNEFGLGQGKIPTISFGIAIAEPDMLQTVSADLLQGLLTCVGSWGAKGHEALIAESKKRYNEPWMTQNAISTYGDMWLIKSALEQAGSTDKAKVMAALKATDTASGPADYYLGDKLAFDSNGRRIGGAVGLIQWQDGKPQLIWPARLAVAKPGWPRS